MKGASRPEMTVAISAVVRSVSVTVDDLPKQGWDDVIAAINGEVLPGQGPAPAACVSQPDLEFKS